MKILSAQQTREADAYTIREEPILSIDLMERAASQLFHAIARIHSQKKPVYVFCGPGNNGGDGLAVARKLAEANYPVHIYILRGRSGFSEDAEINLNRLPSVPWLHLDYLSSNNSLPDIPHGSLIVDALFGSGLNRALTGFPARIVRWLNDSDNQIVSIDIPSGLFAEDSGQVADKAVVMAAQTLSLQFPKLSFFLPENQAYVGEWEVLSIGLDEDFIREVKTKWHYFDPAEADKSWLVRQRFAHKGHFGHGLLCAGSEGKVGAAVLSATASLRSGIGLLSCHVPGIAYSIMQTSIPEAMISTDPDHNVLSCYPGNEHYSAVAVGPGLGTGVKQEQFLLELISMVDVPLVLDADALNILAANSGWLKKLPSKTILTPHPGEYKRLFGDDKNQNDRLNRLSEICNDLDIIVILKGANSAVCFPDKNIWFNTSGNPGMATAGSGDALTGIILSLLARGMEPELASLWAVYIHGRAGDLAADVRGQESLITRDIIEQLGNAFLF